MGVGHLGMGWLGHVGVSGSCRSREGHAGVGWVMLGWGVLCRGWVI